MTEDHEGLTLMIGQGRDGIYAGLGRYVPPGWEWTTNPNRGWRVERIDDDQRDVVVMCRLRKKYWSVRVRDDGQVEIFAGDALAACIHTDGPQGLATRLVAFLNGEDPHQQIVYSIADASRNTGQNMMPHIQECVRLAAETRARIKSYG